MYRHPAEISYPPEYRFTPRARFARSAFGAVGALAIVSAGFFVFGPFSDMSAVQLAAGPFAVDASASGPAPIVLARTGRSWGTAAVQRQLAAASAPITVARDSGGSTP